MVWNAQLELRGRDAIRTAKNADVRTNTKRFLVGFSILSMFSPTEGHLITSYVSGNLLVCVIHLKYAQSHTMYCYWDLHFDVSTYPPQDKMAAIS